MTDLTVRSLEKGAKAFSDELWLAMQGSRMRIALMCEEGRFSDLQSYLDILRIGKRELGTTETSTNYAEQTEFTREDDSYVFYTFLLLDGWDQFTEFLAGRETYPYAERHKKTLEDALTKINDLEGDIAAVNHELGAAHNTIKRQRKASKALLGGKEDISLKIRDVASASRFGSSKKLNYSKIARELGISDKTAKKLCQEERIPFQI